jgi:hypothetical protein
MGAWWVALDLVAQSMVWCWTVSLLVFSLDMPMESTEWLVWKMNRWQIQERHTACFSSGILGAPKSGNCSGVLVATSYISTQNLSRRKFKRWRMKNSLTSMQMMVSSSSILRASGLCSIKYSLLKTSQTTGTALGTSQNGSRMKAQADCQLRGHLPRW